MCLPDYEYEAWNGSSNVLDTSKIDPATLGKSYDTYSVAEIRAWIEPWQLSRIQAFNRASIEILVRGDKLTRELENNVAL